MPLGFLPITPQRWEQSISCSSQHFPTPRQSAVPITPSLGRFIIVDRGHVRGVNCLHFAHVGPIAMQQTDAVQPAEDGERGRTIPSDVLPVELPTRRSQTRLLRARCRTLSANHLRTKVWNRSAAGVDTASRTRSNDTV